MVNWRLSYRFMARASRAAPATGGGAGVAPGSCALTKDAADIASISVSEQEDIRIFLYCNDASAEVPVANDCYT